MPERGGVWPLVAYAALGALALARGAVAMRAGRDALSFPAQRTRGTRNMAEGAVAEGRPRAPRAEGARADPGRGRTADAPWTIPPRGWKDILWRTYEQMNEDRLLTVAAGVVFYGLLALFPALTAFVALYGLIADPRAIDSHLSALGGILPAGAVGIVHETLQRLTGKSGAGLSLGFVVGLLVALWSANSGMKAIIDALNVVYGEREKRGFIKLNLVSFAFTIAGLLGLGVAIAAVVAAPIALGLLGLGAVSDTLIRLLRWPAILVVVVLGLGVVYAKGPSRREPRWRWISVGSAAAAVLWLAGSILFSWYIANFGAYDVTYGSLGAAIGMMMWMWLSMIVILLGAQLNAEIERKTARDSAGEGEKPIGRHGAAKADMVGEAAA